MWPEDFPETSCVPPCFEALEPRVLLAGNVTAFAAGSMLFLYGDESGNDVVVTGTGAQQFRVETGVNSATTINGTASRPLFDGVTALFAVMAGGGDRVAVNDASFAGSVTVLSWGGANLTYFDNAQIGGNLSVLLGAGNDTTRLWDTTVNSGILISDPAGGNVVDFRVVTVNAGAVLVLGGAGDDAVSFDRLAGRGATVLNGPGLATLALTGCNLSSDLFVAGAGTSAYPGGFAQTVAISDSTLGAATVFGGTGRDYFSLGDDSTLNGDLFLHPGPDAHFARIANSTVRGKFTFFSGMGGSLPGAYTGYAGAMVLDNGARVRGAMDVNGSVGDTWVILSSAGTGALTYTSYINAARMDVTSSSIGGFFGVLAGYGAVEGLSVAAYVNTSGMTCTGGFVLFTGGNGTTARLMSSSSVAGATGINGYGADSTATFSDFTCGAGVAVNFSGYGSSVTFEKSASATVISGNVSVDCGVGPNTVIFYGTRVMGTTDVRTSIGDDNVVIDDCSFNNTVTIDAGIEGYPDGYDRDEVRIEQLTSTSAGTTFWQTLWVNTGSDHDTVRLGLGSGVTKSYFYAGFYVNGGTKEGDTLSGLYANYNAGVAYYTGFEIIA